MRSAIIILSLLLATLSGCQQQDKKDVDKEHRYVFTDEIRLPMTPVKDQASSELCWLYAMLATIETDRIGIGDSVNLSVDFLARGLLDDEVTRFFLSRGTHKVSMRGMATAVFTLMEWHGCVGYDAYQRPPQLNYKALARRMMLAARGTRQLSAYKQRVNDIADEHIGAPPKRVYMLGAEYSPHEFARSVALRRDYEALTSFTHHPFGTRFALETPDNTLSDEFLNVPIDSLVARIRQALRAGKAVCWEGDVSEKGFSYSRGVATIELNEQATQALRQRHFEDLRTTDDHCMTIIGTAHNQDGNPFFIMKNSYGTQNPYRGLVYVSEDYVRMKTIAIVTHTLNDAQ